MTISTRGSKEGIKKIIWLMIVSITCSCSSSTEKVYKEYYDNGNIHYQVPLNFEGEYNGTLIEYYNNGKKKKEEIYKEGVLQDFRVYDSLGIIDTSKYNLLFYGYSDSLDLNDTMNLKVKLANQVFSDVSLLIGHVNKNNQEPHLEDTLDVLSSKTGEFFYNICPKDTGIQGVDIKLKYSNRFDKQKKEPLIIYEHFYYIRFYVKNDLNKNNDKAITN